MEIKKKTENPNPEEQKQIEEMAYLVCGMIGKPKTCADCPGKRGGCFTLPKIKILWDAGYRRTSNQTK